MHSSRPEGQPWKELEKSIQVEGSSEEDPTKEFGECEEKGGWRVESGGG
jgi:hypothetical protein